MTTTTLTGWGDRAIAIIAPARGRDWWERDHHLCRTRDAVLRALGLNDEALGRMADPQDIAHYLWAMHGCDAAVVDLSLGVTDDWPSMGDSDSKEPYLRVADYLSHLEWCRRVGVDSNYTLDDSTIRDMVECYSEYVVGEAASLLPDDDPLRKRIERVMRDMDGESVAEIYVGEAAILLRLIDASIDGETQWIRGMVEAGWRDLSTRRPSPDHPSIRMEVGCFGDGTDSCDDWRLDDEGAAILMSLSLGRAIDRGSAEEDRLCRLLLAACSDQCGEIAGAVERLLLQAVSMTAET